MNEVIHQLMERKSVRVYTDQEISPDEKRAILHAAMAAPTAGNQQLYTIYHTGKIVLVFCTNFQK